MFGKTPRLPDGRRGFREGERESIPGVRAIGRRMNAADRFERVKEPRRQGGASSGSLSFRLMPEGIFIMESLILAQNERWRCVLSMQVGRQGGACSSLERRTGE